MKILRLIYCCLLFSAGQACAQLPDYHVRMLQKKTGLVQPTQVEGLIKDDKGFLWLLTPSKAQRFDGKNILSFSFDDRCISIQQDEEGTIWIVARQNIYRYKNDYSGFEKLAQYASDHPAYRGLKAGPGKKLFLLTTEGILQWNRHTKKMEPMGIAAFKSQGSFPFLESFGDWLFYRLDDHTLMRYNVVTAARDSVHVLEANYLVPINADSVWVRQGIGNSVLVSFKTKTLTPVTAANFDTTFSDDHYFIAGGFAGTPGEFFLIIENKGCYAYNPAKKRFKKINLFYNGNPLLGKPLSSNNNYYRENNGTIWFTNEEGFVYFNPFIYNIGLLRSNNTNSAGNQRWNNDVRNFAEDNTGNIWFSTANGFCKWDKTTGKVAAWFPKFTAETYLNYSSVKSIGYSAEKIIIGQSEKGFWIFDPAKQSFKRPQFESDSVQKKFVREFNRNMIRLRNGNFLVLSFGVWLIDKETFFIRPLKISDAGLTARAASEDAQGRIWLLGGNGIVAMDTDLNELYSLPDKIRGRWYDAIVQTDEVTFWVAAKGLYEIKLQAGKQVTIRPIFPELKNVHFSGLFKDSTGNIWMCNEEGIYRYITGKKIIEKFDQNDNVQNFYAGVSNSFRGSDGTVYFGSTNGINYFVPEKIPLQNDSLQVKLLNVTVNKDDSSFLLQFSLQNLNSYQNSVVFDFIAPYLYNAEKVQYRCRLEGAGKDWMNLGNNTSVRFTSLQPGKYTFYAAASLNGKDWFQLRTPFSFKINPPFWKTWWFLVLLATAIILLSILLIKKRIRFIKNREVEKTELQKLRAAGYQTQLETEQIINHFATSMNSVNSVDDILWDVAKNCISKLNFEDCVIYLVNKKTKTLIQKAAWGPKTTRENKIINPIEIPFGKGIVGSVALHGKAEIVNDTSLDERYIIDDAKRMAEITVPIVNEGKVMGIIDSEHPQKNFYTERHLQILTTIASLCAGKIDKIQAEQQTREKEMELLKLNKDFATSQLTALRMQMNPHFIFNALNSIQHYILQGNVVEANKYLSKFSKLQRDILHCSDQQFISLEKELEILNAYLQLEQYRFGGNFTYKINMNAEIEPVEIMVPPMILQPFVENSIWHGLMPLQTERMLTIYFDLESDDVLVVSLRDNGIGRAASAKLKSNGQITTEHESKGMSMVQQRLQLLQLQYGKPFEAAISDITDIKGDVIGTQVELKIFIGNIKS